MLVARICDSDFAALDGAGGNVASGRWNLKGTPIVYTAGSVALAALERRVHAKSAIDYALLSIEIPDTLPIQAVDYIPDFETSQKLGDQWLRRTETAVMRVPSVIVPDSYNFLLNPRHPLFGVIRVRSASPFVFDSRLLSGLHPEDNPDVVSG